MVVAKIEAVLGAVTRTKMSMNSSEKDRRPPEKTSIFGEIILFLKARPFSITVGLSMYKTLRKISAQEEHIFDTFKYF